MTIEFRQHFRKKVGLPGVCLMEKNNTRCDIIIKDISLGGVGVEFIFVHKKYMAEIEVGDVIFVEFKLDNLKETIINKRCTVKIKMDNMIGAEFNDENYSKVLGFYLMQ
ncbi:MAG: PilZ domain-containing protein [Desulfamplus sp.]|nr:PilZ domain-containing protein [Desulfamplus sp.]